MSAYEAVIGLEVHAQLSTQTKLFCGCPTAFGAEPNDHTCPVCLGLPGALPVLNEKAVTYAIRLGLALEAAVPHRSIFARKNYFYPDLPKGYQISQFDHPVVAGGRLKITLEDGSTKLIGITRAHLEEDAGQSSHEGWPQSKAKSYVNLNRAGIPLLEIVSEPEIHSPEEAYAYLSELKALVQYLDICDGNMEEGSLRCDANISIRPVGSKTLGTRTELKNLNSFSNVKRALQHEIDRQIALVSQGQEVQQATLLWDVDTQTTRVMRTKEDSHDYRYFPDPDLKPICITEAQIENVAKNLPELPRQKLERFLKTYELPEQHAQILIGDKHLAAYYEASVATGANPKTCANWILAELMRELKHQESGIQSSPVSPLQLGELVKLIEDKTISGKIAKDVFAEMVKTGKSPEKIVEAKGLRQITDSAILEKMVAEVITAFPDTVEEYRAGKTKVLGFLVGQVMKRCKGKGNPGVINKLLKQHLEH